MKKQKFNLSCIEGKLTKMEMKKIIGGSGNKPDKMGRCESNYDCPSGYMCINTHDHKKICMRIN